MATKGIISATLSDVAKRLEPNGKIAKLVELLKQTNEILEDAQWVEGNLPTGHRTTIRTGLPSVTWRMLNYGVQPSKSTTKQVDDSCGMLEAYAEVDKSLADLNGNKKDFRFSEEKSFIQAMNQEMASTMFYGNTDVHPQRFMGLTARFNALSGFDAAKNVINYGGTGDVNTSAWLVGWSEDTLHGIYPKGSTAGLHTADLGEQTLTDVDGGMYQGYRTHYKWDCGMVLRDWRYASRICNIDTSDFSNIIENGSTSLSSATKLIRMMIKAMNLIPAASNAKLVWYMNKDLRTMLDIMAMEKANVQLSIKEFEGKPVTSFLGIPIRRVDALLNTEERVQ